MFISKKDLDNLESKLREEFNGTIKEILTKIEEKQTLPRQKTKKVVD